MMTKNKRLLPLDLLSAAAMALVLTALPVRAQTAPAQSAPAAPAKPAPAAPAQAPATSPDKAKQSSKIELSTKLLAPPAPVPDRSQAYYHAALAATYEEEAVSQGHPELITRAVEEYKLALNADPNSAQLSLALAGLHFTVGRLREAESTARELLKSQPENVDAHQLLGRI